MNEKWKQYKNIVGYAIGQYYETVKKEVFQIVKLTHLCDKKWDENPVTELRQLQENN